MRFFFQFLSFALLLGNGAATYAQAYFILPDGTRYVIVEGVGKGGFATVHLAHKEGNPKEEVAIKAFEGGEGSSLTGNKDYVRAIQDKRITEFKNLQKVFYEGPAILETPYRTGSESVVVGEILGTDLKTFFESQLSSKDMERAARMALQQLLEGLINLNAAGLGHNDLSYKNVLVSRPRVTGKDFLSGQAQMKIVDFDLVRPLYSVSPEVLFGNPIVLSPDVAFLHSRTNGSSDLYSLSCMISDLLLHKSPQVAVSNNTEQFMSLLADKTDHKKAVQWLTRSLQTNVEAFKNNPSVRRDFEVLGTFMLLAFTWDPAERIERLSRSGLVEFGPPPHYPLVKANIWPDRNDLKIISFGCDLGGMRQNLMNRLQP